jgi:uncharacterized protein DUF4406
MDVHHIYLAGPMAGKPDLNLVAFQVAADYLRWHRKPDSPEVTIPHDIQPYNHDGECPGGYRSSPDSPHAAACYLRTDVSFMLDCADEVYVLPGWEASIGARLEVQVAATCGLPISFFGEETLKDLVRNHYDTSVPMDGSRHCRHEPYNGGPHCAELTCLNYAGRYCGK